MGILEEIRAACSPLHRELEDDLDVVATILDAGAYAGLLGRFKNFLEVLEPRIEARFEFDPDDRINLDLASRRKVPALAADLAELDGRGFVSRRSMAAPEVPLVDQRPRAWGCLYVLEGSTLGGQVMAKHFRAMPGVGSAVRYFAGHGPETGPRWKRFTLLLGERFDHAAAEIRGEVVDAAATCFGLMGRALAASAIYHAADPPGAEKRSTPDEPSPA